SLSLPGFTAALSYSVMLRRLPRPTRFPTRRSSDLLKELPDDAPNVIIGSVNINSKKKGSKLMGSVDVRQGLDLEYHENSFNFSLDRKSTRLNSSHVKNSYAVFCLKKTNVNLTAK